MVLHKGWDRSNYITTLANAGTDSDLSAPLHRLRYANAKTDRHAAARCDAAIHTAANGDSESLTKAEHVPDEDAGPRDVSTDTDSRT